MEVKQLCLDWLHASHLGIENVGFQQLVVALQRAPHDSLFSTELIITLVEHFWDAFFKVIMLRAFLPYCFFFSAVLIYMTQYAVAGVPD